jgi:NAD(P)-dependent dehydrogenase (short-subunit alcohol dehydrogenase family)
LLLGALSHRPSARRLRFASACAAQQAQDKTATTYPRAVLVTGANKGQGFALCRRILAEHTDTRVFLCSRDAGKGQAAAAELAAEFGGARLCLVPLDVSCTDSVARARQVVGVELGSASLHGLVSNAGVMWGHSRQELFRVCAAGVRNVLDAFLPLCADGARVVIVSSGLSPLMLGYASEARRAALTHPAVTWETIQGMMSECLAVADYAQDVKAQVLNLPALLSTEVQILTELRLQHFADWASQGGRLKRPHQIFICTDLRRCSQTPICSLSRGGGGASVTLWGWGGQGCY